MKTYIIAADEYMGSAPGMTEFIGTFRQLLEHLTEHLTDYADWKDDPDLRHSFGDDLIDLFKQGNGDGQPFLMVWCVEDRKQVL